MHTISVFFITTVLAFAAQAATPAPQTESYKNLIEKARNLALTRDRLQASQVLQRGIQHESKTSLARKEMIKALEDLTNLFYTEKGQSLFAQAESASEANPKSAIETYQAALREEEGNVSVLKAIARMHLVGDECDKADGYAKQAEAMNPYSAEVRLLRLQVADCQNAGELLASLLTMTDLDMSAVERFTKSLQIKEALRHKDLKKAKAVLAAWEQANSDYPEVLFWRWKISSEPPATPMQIDRTAGAKYIQLCQNLTTRKKKTFNLDVDLCRNKEKVEEALKESNSQEGASGSDN